MCGIFGGYNIPLDDVKKGINLIKRGNDGITISELGDKVFFAARRHAIKFSGNEDNLSGHSDQPYFSEDNNIALIFNGEFYNFDIFKKDLIKENIDFKTDGDTEVLLKLYEKKWGGAREESSNPKLYSLHLIFSKN